MDVIYPIKLPRICLKKSGRSFNSVDEEERFT